MTTLTLLVKASHNAQLRAVDELLKDEFAELDVEAKVLGTAAGRWVQVSVAGEDEAIAASYIRKKIGVCPVSLGNVEVGGVLKGYVSGVDAVKGELRVDVGVFEPKATLATITLATLQTQLLRGRDVDFKKAVGTFALAEGLPLCVEVTGLGEELQAKLSPEQVKKLQSWQQSLLDRLIVLGAPRETIDEVLERTRLTRDVVEVEDLGLFEHALTCKLGTDAAGLIPRVGRYLRNSGLLVFNAKRSVDFLSSRD